jgi:hypothetical protein
MQQLCLNKSDIQEVVCVAVCAMKFGAKLAEFADQLAKIKANMEQIAAL